MALADGRYIAKLMDYGIGKTKEELPQVIALFQFKDLPQENPMWWIGSLKGGAFDYTLKTLQLMGFKKDGDLADLADGLPSGVLNTNREYELTIKNEVYNGKNYTKIAFVNLPGGPIGGNRLSKEEAKALMIENFGVSYAGPVGENPTKVEQQKTDEVVPF